MISIVLFVVMFIGMTQANCTQDGVYNYCSNELWSGSRDTFAVRDILSMFGHANGMHLLGNSLWLLVFAVPAELVLGRKKFIAGVAIAMVVQVISNEILRENGLGASGWLAAMPGLMFGASMWKIWHESEDIEMMGFPSMLFAIGVAAFAMDVKAIGNSDGVDHMSHISGFVTGSLFVIAGLPFLVMTIKKDIRAWQRRRAWKNRMA